MHVLITGSVSIREISKYEMCTIIDTAIDIFIDFGANWKSINFHVITF